MEIYYSSGLALMVGALLILLVILHKVRRVHLMLYALENQLASRSDNIFRQFEALLGLYIELTLRKS